MNVVKTTCFGLGNGYVTFLDNKRDVKGTYSAFWFSGVLGEILRIFVLLCLIPDYFLSEIHRNQAIYCPWDGIHEATRSVVAISPNRARAKVNEIQRPIWGVKFSTISRIQHYQCLFLNVKTISCNPFQNFDLVYATKQFLRVNWGKKRKFL